MDIFSKRNISKTFILLGTFFVFLSLTHRALRNRSLFLGNVSYVNSNQLRKSVDIPSHIYIEKKINVDIVENNNNFDVPDKKAVFLTQSSLPNEKGNIIVFGHNNKNVLGNIRYLTGKEEIVLTTLQGKKYFYSIDEINEVSPSETKYLQPTKEEILTIYTCSGFLDKNRFIVRAKRKES